MATPRGKPRKAFSRLIAALRAHYGAPHRPPPANAFEHLLWDKVAYLATDERRATAFEALRTRVGLTPQAIIDADPKVLRAVAALGGRIAIEGRVEHMQDAAATVIDDFGGSLDGIVARPLPEAKRALQRFHGIGEPGAERILLLVGAQPLLAPDSNALRVLVRVGYGTEDTNYSRMYRGARDAVAPEVPASVDDVIDAHLLLRQHGQTVCKTNAPRCEICVLADSCSYAVSRAKAPRSR